MDELFRETCVTFVIFLECLFRLTSCAIRTAWETVKWAWRESLHDVKRGTVTVLFIAMLPFQWMFGRLTKTKD